MEGTVEEVTSDSYCRKQRNAKIIKRRRDTARQSHPESIHAQTKYHCKKQRQSCMRQRWERLSRKELCRC